MKAEKLKIKLAKTPVLIYNYITNEKGMFNMKTPIKVEQEQCPICGSAPEKYIHIITGAANEEDGSPSFYTMMDDLCLFYNLDEAKQALRNKIAELERDSYWDVEVEWSNNDREAEVRYAGTYTTDIWSICTRKLPN